MNKRAMADISTSFWLQWPELLSGLLLVTGIVIAASLQNAYISYGVVFCAGLIVGRLIYFTKGRQPLFPFLLICFGFLVGYVIGSYFSNINQTIVAALFLLGAILGYKAYKKGYVK